MKQHWRPMNDKQHLFVRIGKRGKLGMNFTSLCGTYWMSTVKHDRPRPYPPASKDCCTKCLNSQRPEGG